MKSTLIRRGCGGWRWRAGVASRGWFQWGPAGTLTQATAPVAVGSGSGVVLVSAGVSGLQPARQYESRLVVSNALGGGDGRGDALHDGGAGGGVGRQRVWAGEPAVGLGAGGGGGGGA
jgi:hypothetical protein